MSSGDNDDFTLTSTAFTTCIPPQGPTCSPVKAHQAHLLALLYHTLPSLPHFAESKADKDKDLLFRLRAEIQTLSQQTGQQAPPSPKAEFSPTLTANAMAAKTQSGTGIGRVAPPPGSGNENTVRRKPSPTYDGVGPASLGQSLGPLVETVGQVWNVPHDVLERDLADTRQHGALEKVSAREDSWS